MPVLQQTPVISYTANGSVKSFAFPFCVLSATDLGIYKNGIAVTSGYSISGIGNQEGGSVIFAVAPASGSIIRIVRETTISRTTDFVEGGYVQADVLDSDFDRLTMMIQEVDALAVRENASGEIDMSGRFLVNLPDPVDAGDAVNKQYVDQSIPANVAAAAASALAAATSESNADVSEANAAASAAAAALSEANAAISEANALSAALGGALKITATDTTPGFISNKLTVSGGLSKSVVNAGGDEQLNLNVTFPVTSVFARGGDVVLTSADVHTALADSLDIDNITTTTKPAGDVSTSAATTEFVSLSGSRPSIDYVSANGYNSFLIQSEGKLYEAHGTASYSNHTSGRNITDQSYVTSLDKASQVPIPDTSPVVKSGLGGNGFAYALLANGNLYTWGNNGFGQCGVGHTSPVNFPTLAATGVVEVYNHPSTGCYAANENRLFIKKSDGYIYGAGYNTFGGLGLGDATHRNVFTQITAAGQNPLFVANVGSSYGCLIVQKPDKTIWMAGYNGYGQLGTGNATVQTSLVNVTAAWNGGNNNMLITSVHGGFGYYTSSGAGSSALMILMDDGTNTLLRTCGCNDWGCLGDGTATTRYLPVTPNVGTGRINSAQWSADGVGTVHVLKEDGTLYGFGYNGFGQVGNGTTTQVNTPTIVATGVSKLICEHFVHTYGHYHSAFIVKTDGLYSAGYNTYGTLGVGDTTNRSTFTKVLLPQSVHTNIKMMGAFSSTANTRIFVVVTNNNTMYAWGHNGQSAIFSGNTAGNISSPVLFELIRGE